jgi:hypothetical protein
VAVALDGLLVFGEWLLAVLDEAASVIANARRGILLGSIAAIFVGCMGREIQSLG